MARVFLVFGSGLPVASRTRRARAWATALAAFAMLVLTEGAQPASAAINKQVNFQGRLTDPSGVAVADGTYNLEFKFHNHATNAGGAQGVCSGACVWMETRTGANRVQVTRGQFAVQLGSVASLAAFNFNQDPLYLSVEVGGTPGVPVWDGEMTSRHRLGAAPTAIWAADADLLDGQTGTYYTNAANLTGTVADARLGSNVAFRNIDNTFSASQTVTGQLVLPTSGAGGGLVLGGDTNLYRNAASELRTDDNFMVRTATNSAQAFRVLDSGGSPRFQVDSFTPEVTMSARTVINHSGAASALRINESGAGDALELQQAGTPRFTVAANGTLTCAACIDYSDMAGLPSASVTRTMNINNNVWTSIPFTTELFDSHVFHDNAVNPTRLTIPFSGRYLVTALASYATNGTGGRAINIKWNGLATSSSDEKAGNSGILGMSGDVDVSAAAFLNAGDYVEVSTLQNSGAALSTTAAFTVIWLGP